MTNLLEEAIKSVRQLPEADQDEAAEILLSLASNVKNPSISMKRPDRPFEKARRKPAAGNSRRMRRWLRSSSGAADEGPLHASRACRP